MDTNHLELDNLDMVEGAIRLLKGLEQNGLLSVAQAGLIRLDLMDSMEDILDDMDKQMMSMMR